MVVWISVSFPNQCPSQVEHIFGVKVYFQCFSLIVSSDCDDDEDQEHNVCWLVGRIWIEICLVSLVTPSPLFAPSV